MSAAQVPELQRGELAGTVLQLKALGVDNVMTFDYLAPPPAQAMVKAAELLFSLGAIDDKSRRTPVHGQVHGRAHCTVLMYR